MKAQVIFIIQQKGFSPRTTPEYIHSHKYVRISLPQIFAIYLNYKGVYVLKLCLNFETIFGFSKPQNLSFNPDRHSFIWGIVTLCSCTWKEDPLECSSCKNHWIKNKFGCSLSDPIILRRKYLISSSFDPQFVWLISFRILTICCLANSLYSPTFIRPPALNILWVPPANWLGYVV